jgi:BirA family biotin operon repressor/biotin-[acetyl-CoA-carboxylase] ligase
MKDKILHILKESTDYVSGEKISNLLNVSRTAIWKNINSLKEEGYKIDSVSRKGYKLINSPDILSYEEIEPYLNTTYIGRNILYFNTIDSTNKKAKDIAESSSDGTVVISEEQTAGRGRLGRNWSSPKGKSLLISILLKPNIDPSKVSNITLVGAVALVKTLENFGIEGLIKWPNDIIINDKKIAGILTEMSAEINQVNYIVMGIGVNLYVKSEEFPEDIRHKAGSILSETGRSIDRKEFTGKFLNYFEKYYQEYFLGNNFKEIVRISKEKSILLSKEVRIISRDTTYEAKVLDITEEGHLLIEKKDGTKEEIYSGEVSVRGKNGYI